MSTSPALTPAPLIGVVFKEGPQKGQYHELPAHFPCKIMAFAEGTVHKDLWAALMSMLPEELDPQAGARMFVFHDNAWLEMEFCAKPKKVVLTLECLVDPRMPLDEVRRRVRSVLTVPPMTGHEGNRIYSINIKLGGPALNAPQEDERNPMDYLRPKATAIREAHRDYKNEGYPGDLYPLRDTTDPESRIMPPYSG